MIRLSKRDIIEKLVDDDIDTIVTQGLNSETEYLARILREGFKGYNNVGSTELEQEYYERFDEETEIT